MRDDQILFFYPAAAVREDVEVERARSPAVRRSPSEASFEGLERSQQRARIELRIERNDRIHEIRLIDHAPGLRSVKTGALYDHPELAQGNDRSFDVRGGVVLVRPDPDVCKGHQPFLARTRTTGVAPASNPGFAIATSASTIRRSRMSTSRISCPKRSSNANELVSSIERTALATAA